MFYYDPTYLILLPGIILTLLAQLRVNRITKQFEKIFTRSGLTGAQLARQMLDDGGLSDVNVEVISGRLTDHYDPSAKTLRLSSGVAGSSSVTALGIAAHETGHALQHRDAYKPLMLRSASVTTANIGSQLSWPLVLLGLVLSWQPLVGIGIGLFSLTVLFSLITLPVEFNASRRALAALGGYMDNEELNGAEKVLGAAALTYVASAFNALLQLLRLVAISNRRRRR